MHIELCSFSATDLNPTSIDASIRVELCSNYYEGGCTPSPASFLKCRQELANEIFVMIRPRGGDFIYSDDEYELMMQEILWFKENGADGIVIGILDINGRVDVKRTKRLVEIAAPLEVTFHRAFDMTLDLNRALEDVISTGCTRILSSGGASDVDHGFDTLLTLQRQAKGRIELMPGGGVSINNAQKFIDAGFKNIHLSSKLINSSSISFKKNLSMTANNSISSFDYIGLDVLKLKEFIGYVKANI